MYHYSNDDLDRFGVNKDESDGENDNDDNMEGLENQPNQEP